MPFFRLPVSRNFFALLTLSLLMAAGSALALNDGVQGASLETLFPGATYQAGIPTQFAVTGVNPAERPLRPEEIVAYCQALADASPRARLVEFARTFEGRPLVYLAISDEQTIARLDEFQKDHQALMDPRTGGVPATADLGGKKAVAWLAYGIHGDELSSPDAAVALAYWLTAGQDAQATELRDKLVILIDPSENPDGRGRYLAQTTSFAHKNANPDQDDLSHRAVWPWGRGNHYLFDMNRDWFTMIHPESARSEEIASWLPQMLVDSHEMGANSSYLFPPPRHPFNPNLPPNVAKWELSFSNDQAAALDVHGFPYFSGEWNEEFFPGYGSSWVAYHGAIGILYEMSRTSGTLVRKKGGTLRTFAQAVEHQVTSSVANLSSLAADHAEILHDMIAARQGAIQAGSKGNLKAWIFPPDPRHPRRTADFAALLTKQGLEVQVLSGKPVKGAGLVSATTGDKIDRELPTGTLLVRLDQPAGHMAHALLDPHVAMETQFFQEEREYLEKQKGSRLYETTAWSLPLIRGIPAYWSEKIPGGTWTEPAPATAPASAAIAQEFTSLIIDGDPDLAPRVLADLLQEGINVRIAEKPFTIAGHDFQRGAMVIVKEANEPGLVERLQPIADHRGVTMVPVTTSRSDDGPDLGGRHFSVLVEPRVGVLAGMPISPGQFGSVWHLLDQELDLRFSSLDVSRVSRTDLSRYNVLVFPPVMGGPGMYRQAIGIGGMEKVRQWVRAGGTAIGFGGGAEMLADEKTELTTVRFRSQALDVYPPPVWSLAAREAEAAGRLQATGMRVAAAPTAENGAVNEPAGHGSLFDVAPIIGPGARPFVTGHDQGTALRTQPMPLAEWIQGTLPSGRMAPEEEDLAAADARLRRFMPQGALLRIDLDPEFWLNYGLDENITAWFGGDDTLIAAGSGTVGALFPDIDRLHLGGLLWPEAAARMAHTAYAVREGVGRGQVILFAANPVYRRWVKDTERMFMNAVLLGPGMGSRWSRPW